MSATEWSDVDMAELLPTGTVTLLLADVEGSTQLWETQPEAMTAAIARMNQTASKLVEEHDGVRPVEQGEGDSFVAAFARAGDAVACALELQRTNLSPIRLRIGVHTGDASVCATRATTRARRSTRPRGCATWRTAAKPCCRV
jgi:class 3 adenylate cyclase